MTKNKLNVCKSGLNNKFETKNQLQRQKLQNVTGEWFLVPF